MEIKQLKFIIESLIFASDTPLSIRQMTGILADVEPNEIEDALALLENDLDGRAFFLNKVSGGYQFATKPEFSKWIRKMSESKSRTRMTRAALETLAIIAFKQPISRIEVAAIRGVNSDGVIKTLLERKLVTITGRDKEQGRALLFSTTSEFLQYFNLNNISDLPRPKEIEELLAEGEGGKLLQEIPEVYEEEAEEEQTKESAENKPEDGAGDGKAGDTAEPQAETGGEAVSDGSDNGNPSETEQEAPVEQEQPVSEKNDPAE